jgi:hypothetical protein
MNYTKSLSLANFIGCACPAHVTVSQLANAAGSGDPAYNETEGVNVGRVPSRGGELRGASLVKYCNR